MLLLYLNYLSKKEEKYVCLYSGFFGVLIILELNLKVCFCKMNIVCIFSSNL